MPNNPPVDTPFFAVKGRISEVWRLWLNSITTAANAVAGALLAANNLSDLTNDGQARQNLGLGSAATHNVTDFDAVGAASAAVASIPTSSSTQTKPALLTPADWATFNGKQSALGFVPLNPANNLSEVASPTTSLANLGGVTSAQAAAAAPVQTVNGQTGAVSLTIPTNTNQLINGAGFITASGAPVQSVNGQTGAVSLSIPAAQVAANLANSSSTGVTGTLPIGNGGTGQTTQQAALNALTGTQAAGKFLRSDGTNATLASIQASDVPTLNQSTTGTAANVTGTVAIANGGTGATTAAAGLSALGGAALSGTNNFTANNGFGNVANPQASVNIAAGQSLQIGANTDSYYTTASNNGLQFHRANSTSYVDQSGLGGSLALRCSVSAGGDTTVLTLSPSAATFGKTIVVPSVAPATSSATGTAGSITWDASYLYVCVSASSWRRVALSTF